jgi:hypothetical protein
MLTSKAALVSDNFPALVLDLMKENEIISLLVSKEP